MLKLEINDPKCFLVKYKTCLSKESWRQDGSKRVPGNVEKKKDIVLSVEWQWRRLLYDKENYPWKLGRARGIYIILT